MGTTAGKQNHTAAAGAGAEAGAGAKTSPAAIGADDKKPPPNSAEVEWDPLIWPPQRDPAEWSDKETQRMERELKALYAHMRDRSMCVGVVMRRWTTTQIVDALFSPFALAVQTLVRVETFKAAHELVDRLPDHFAPHVHRLFTVENLGFIPISLHLMSLPNAPGFLGAFAQTYLSGALTSHYAPFGTGHADLRIGPFTFNFRGWSRRWDGVLQTPFEKALNEQDSWRRSTVQCYWHDSAFAPVYDGGWGPALQLPLFYAPPSSYELQQLFANARLPNVQAYALYANVIRPYCKRWSTAWPDFDGFVRCMQQWSAKRVIDSQGDNCQMFTFRAREALALHSTRAFMPYVNEFVFAKSDAPWSEQRINSIKLIKTTGAAAYVQYYTSARAAVLNPAKADAALVHGRWECTLIRKSQNELLERNALNDADPRMDDDTRATQRALLQDQYLALEASYYALVQAMEAVCVRFIETQQKRHETALTDHKYYESCPYYPVPLDNARLAMWNVHRVDFLSKFGNTSFKPIAAAAAAAADAAASVGNPSSPVTPISIGSVNSITPKSDSAPPSKPAAVNR